MSITESCNCKQSEALQESIDLIYILLTNKQHKYGKESAIKHLKKKVSKKLL